MSKTALYQQRWLALLILLLLPIAVTSSPAASAGLSPMPPGSGECDIALMPGYTDPCASSAPHAGVGVGLTPGSYSANNLTAVTDDDIAVRSIPGPGPSYTAIDGRVQADASGKAVCPASNPSYVAGSGLPPLIGYTIVTTPNAVVQCARYVKNLSNNSIFIPFKTPTEWSAFLNNLPAGITTLPAAVPNLSGFLTVVPGGAAPNNCAYPSPASYSIGVPYYAPVSTSIPAPMTKSFTCTVKGLCGTGHPTCGADQTWTQIASITYLSDPAPDSTTGSVGWSIKTSYSGTAPAPAPAPQDGACSSGRGGCSVGSTLGLRNSGYTWYWTCSGVNGGESSDAATGGNLCSDTDGSCGGAAFSCGTGNPANGSDSGSTATWSCTGINGGVTVNNCSACDSGYVLINGSCEMPIAGQCGGNDWSCNVGNAVNGSSDGNNDYWYCTGTNTGAESPQCRFALAKNGQCGGNDWSCNVGNAFAGSQNNYTDYWYCSGVNGGGNSGQCSFAHAQTGQCGGNDWSCNLGSAFAGSSDSNNDYWYCSGINGGGNSGVCTYARPVNGACATVYYSPTPVCSGKNGDNCTIPSPPAPACASGTPANYNGSSWTCQGQNGGTSAGCAFTEPDNGGCWNGNGGGSCDHGSG